MFLCINKTKLAILKNLVRFLTFIKVEWTFSIIKNIANPSTVKI